MAKPKKTNSELYGDLSLDEDDVELEAESQLEDRKVDHLGVRTNMLSKISAGDRVEKTFYKVDPTRCRIWEEHDREYSLLDESSCADLIEGFKSAGKQLFPAIVRAVADTDEYDWEVIAGARRHWTSSYFVANNLGDYPFLIDPQDLSDEEAFRISDIENRDRQDISDMERARKYKKALEKYYPSQRAMAERLQVEENWLTKFLRLANVPDRVVAAYPSLTDIRCSHADKILGVLKDRRLKDKFLERADEIAKQQAEYKEAGKDPIKGVNVLKMLCAAPSNTKTSSLKTGTYKAESGKKVLSAKKLGNGDLVLTVKGDKAITSKDVMEACKKAIDDLREE